MQQIGTHGGASVVEIVVINMWKNSKTWINLDK